MLRLRYSAYSATAFLQEDGVGNSKTCFLYGFVSSEQFPGKNETGYPVMSRNPLRVPCFVIVVPNQGFEGQDNRVTVPLKNRCTGKGACVVCTIPFFGLRMAGNLKCLNPPKRVNSRGSTHTDHPLTSSHSRGLLQSATTRDRIRIACFDSLELGGENHGRYC